MSRFALLGVRVRVGIREQRKIKRRSKGTTKPLMANLDISHITHNTMRTHTKTHTKTHTHIHMRFWLKFSVIVSECLLCPLSSNHHTTTSPHYILHESCFRYTAIQYSCLGVLLRLTLTLLHCNLFSDWWWCNSRWSKPPEYHHWYDLFIGLTLACPNYLTWCSIVVYFSYTTKKLEVENVSQL